MRVRDDLPDHHPDCRPREGWCADECERYDAIMVEAMWGDRHAQPPSVYDSDYMNRGWIRHLDENGTRSTEMLGTVIVACCASFVWLWVGVAIGWWWFG